MPIRLEVVNCCQMVISTLWTQNIIRMTSKNPALLRKVEALYIVLPGQLKSLKH